VKLRVTFESFGEINTLSVKIIKMNDEDKKFGMIDFATKEGANKALMEAPES
jgi:hypothetical protein